MTGSLMTGSLMMCLGIVVLLVGVLAGIVMGIPQDVMLAPALLSFAAVVAVLPVAASPRAATPVRAVAGSR